MRRYRAHYDVIVMNNPDTSEVSSKKTIKQCILNKLSCKQKTLERNDSKLRSVHILTYHVSFLWYGCYPVCLFIIMINKHVFTLHSAPVFPTEKWKFDSDLEPITQEGFPAPFVMMC